MTYREGLPELLNDWVHDDGTPCPVYLAPANGTRWWCTDHQMYLKRPDSGSTSDPVAVVAGAAGPWGRSWPTWPFSCAASLR